MYRPPDRSARGARARVAKAYHHGNLRRALLDAALALEPAQGPRGISLREVARRIGVTHAAAYHHFASREALIQAAADEGFQKLLDRLRYVAERQADPLSLLMEVGAEYVRFALRSPSYFRFMFGAPPADAGERAIASPGLTLVRDVFARAIEFAQSGGLIAAGPSRRLAARLWSTAHGLAALALAEAFDEPADAPRTTPHRAANERRVVSLARTAMAGFVYGVGRPRG